MDCLSEELGIPKKYLKTTCREDRFIAIVPKVWLRSLVKHLKVMEFNQKCKFDSWPYRNAELDDAWTKVYVKMFMKCEAKVIPLPKASAQSFQAKLLLFPQFMQYISQSNYKNLWRQAYKKYNLHEAGSRVTQVILADFNDVLRELVARTYNCPIVNVFNENLTLKGSDNSSHSSLYPCVCAVETLNAIFLLHAPYKEHNLYDCLTFSPSILQRCYTKPMFVVYQLISCFKALHERSLTVGDITLGDIYLDDDLWLHVFPQLKSNLHLQEVSREEGKAAVADCRKGHRFQNMKCCNCGLRTFDKVQVNNSQISLEKLCELWIGGLVSNYTYLMGLNALSGRRFGDPNCHYVFPWVTDFETRGGKNWRDLKKSKFRLNKGDRQLDLTYEHADQVPHHVSDVLSSITYYVYTARRTPKNVLCKYVRPNWVPAEYPVSIQRLQEWTPDECIPEFFSDPTIFKSIHDDLDDLDVPPWCSSPEDFIEKHREALESQHVSERLHHWIDLTFGYKLSGSAAVKSKNVCLQLVDGHTNLMSSGVVQLFMHPHPTKTTSLPFWGKTPPKLFGHVSRRAARERSSSVLETSKSEEEDLILEEDISGGFKPLVLTRLLSRSRSSLNEEKRSLSSQRSTSVGPKNPTFTSHLSGDCIGLPKEFNPGQALIDLENLQMFFAKTFHTEEGKKFKSNEEQIKEEESLKPEVQNAFTNHAFQPMKTTKSFTFPIDNNLFALRSRGRNNLQQKNSNEFSCNYEEIVTARRVREMQILGCLIVEIFLHAQLRSLECPNSLNNSKSCFNSRLKRCLTILNTTEVPPCIKSLVKYLLQPQDSYDLNDFKYLAVSNLGLPPPSAHLLLEPLMQTMLPFNEHFEKLHAVVSDLKRFEALNTELEIIYHCKCNGEMCEVFESVTRTKILLMQNIAECKVKSCVMQIEQLIDAINPNKDLEIVNILMLHVRKLIEDPPTAVLSAWYLFDHIAKMLGPENCTKCLLGPILKLYERECNETILPFNVKIAKLYHHSFLLRLMVRFGLKVFLEHFTAPLVEAVGGYRDFEKTDLIMHSHHEKRKELQRKTSNLKSMDEEAQECSPSDESSESETNKPAEVFHFDGEEIMEQLQSNISSDLPFNHSTAEEALDTLAECSDGQSTTTARVLSPTIAIPGRNANFISCRKSGEELHSATSSDAGSSQKKREQQKDRAQISSMSADSVIWLSHRLGPVLTARFLSRNLLKMLTLCYVGKENLIAASMEGPDFMNIACGRVLGDVNAAKVLECLASIAALYGHQLILYQYLPHMSELIALCKRKLTATLEGGLISCLALLKHIIPYISDTTLMENLQDIILKNIVHPTIRLLGSTKHTFPNGSVARNVLARKYLDTLYVLSLRMGATMTKDHLAVPALQRFFLIFDKIADSGYFQQQIAEKKEDLEGSSFIEVRRDGTTAEWNIGGRPVQISHVRLRDSDSTDSLSPPAPTKDNLSDDTNLALQELEAVFTPDLAHTAYKPFLRQIGLQAMELSLKNHRRIYAIYEEHEQQQKSYKSCVKINQQEEQVKSSSIGSNVALIGNRIDVQEQLEDQVDALSYVSNKIENTVRHLRGNWLAYWEHEIGRADKDVMFNFKQIKLQTFNGHSNSVKCLHVLDNENSFLSGSKDKTVKLWSLRSQGDGNNVTSCQSTYSAHKKPVFSICFLESLRLTASCDGSVHLWDPFLGVSVGQLESSKLAPIVVLKGLPAPSNLLFAASAECSVKVIDARIMNYVHELKVSVNPGITIRCLALSPLGLWLAVGFCSGNITVLDTRTGLVLTSWRAHDSDILKIVPADEDTVISTGLDQTVSVWNVHDGKYKFCMKGTTEAVHCLQVYNDQLITGTTGNRIGVHTSIDCDSSFSSTKLRSDAFKGNLTAMSILPLNRLLLLGADSGNIHLLC